MSIFNMVSTLTEKNNVLQFRTSFTFLFLRMPMTAGSSKHGLKVRERKTSRGNVLGCVIPGGQPGSKWRGRGGERERLRTSGVKCGHVAFYQGPQEFQASSGGCTSNHKEWMRTGGGDGDESRAHKERGGMMALHQDVAGGKHERLRCQGSKRWRTAANRRWAGDVQVQVAQQRYGPNNYCTKCALPRPAFAGPPLPGRVVVHPRPPYKTRKDSGSRPQRAGWHQCNPVRAPPGLMNDVFTSGLLQGAVYLPIFAINDLGFPHRAQGRTLLAALQNLFIVDVIAQR
ncbi:hypothetical protein K438DRAFT_1777859 [Mycena galopus ATCC 62051]|nr:hypothetical protein K438DRAFT_1777859 [Mycena galopus ATCC 62051]